MSTFFNRLARALETDEDRIARTSAEIQHEMWQREYKKWDKHIQECKLFVESQGSNFSLEDGVLEARRWAAFWREADRELGRKQRKNASAVETRVLERILSNVSAMRLRQDLHKLRQSLEATLGLNSADPLDEKRLEDFQILDRIAKGDNIFDADPERHEFLLKFSESYRLVVGVHERQTQNPNLGTEYLNALQPLRAQKLLEEWERHGFDARKARNELRLLSGENRDAPVPEPRLIRKPRDAELVALEWMRFWGFDDAEATPVGADEGIDVVSETAVAQVKAHMVPIGRPDLQNLAGVAAVEGKTALFFALTGYTTQAIQWADRAKMALFTFDLQGVPEPVNNIARDYQTAG